MAALIVPAIERGEAKIWATLGDQVAEWLEANAVYGPGSKFGQPLVIDDEFYAWLVRTYQIFPHGHPREGRRRFKRCVTERTKGTGKTEWAIDVAQAEFHPTAPVRCHGFERRGRAWVPIGGAPPAPRLIFVASTEDQVQRTAFGRFREALKKSPLAGDYHITMEKVVLLGDSSAAAGEAYPLAISPSAADGDLPTWEHIDEGHRWTMPRHHEMHDAIVENLLKDVSADAWVMMTSTAGIPGEDSVEERILQQAEAIDRGEVDEPTLWFHRRYAPDDMPLETPKQVEAFVREARGPAAEWSGDIPSIVNRFFEPKVDRMYWRRVWGNQWTRGARTAFDSAAWARNSSDREVTAGTLIVLGFDGSLSQDGTALIATDIFSPHQWPVGIWIRPLDAADNWEIPQDEIDAAVDETFERLDVWRLYGDPYRWREPMDRWRGKYGEKRIISWNTTRWKAMAHACRNYATAIETNDFTNDGDAEMARHIGNARRKELKGLKFEDDSPMWVLTKDRHLDLIDGAVAGVLSWEARNDAITAGAKPTKTRSRVMRSR